MSDRDTIVTLPERFTIDAAADALAAITGRAGGVSSLTLDCAEVMAVDTASLQLLAVLRRDFAEDSRTLELAAVPELMADDARLLGLDELLGLAATG
jgi:ABC-type transporter Mla MlaB component